MGLLPCPNLPLWVAEKSFSSSDVNHFPSKKAFSPAVPFHLNPQPIMLWARPDLLQDAVGEAPVLEETLAQRFARRSFIKYTQPCLCRLPVSAATESRTDSATGSDGKQNLEGGGGDANKNRAEALALRPFRLIFRRRLTLWKPKLTYSSTSGV